MSKIDSVKFDLFDFLIATDQSEPITTQPEIAFSLQTPNDPSMPLRAVIVMFDSGKSNVLRFHARCRVSIRFEPGEDILEDKELISQFYRQAYMLFCKKSNDTLCVLGQNPMVFPELE